MPNLSIGAAAKAANLPIKTVRYYDEIELVRPQARTSSGYRQYGPQDIARLTFVRRARAFGFTIDQCRELLDLYQDQTRSSANVKKLAAQHLAEIDARLDELQKLRTELALLVSACKGDNRPHCPIIDSFAKA